MYSPLIYCTLKLLGSGALGVLVDCPAEKEDSRDLTVISAGCVRGYGLAFGAGPDGGLETEVGLQVGSDVWWRERTTDDGRQARRRTACNTVLCSCTRPRAVHPALIPPTRQGAASRRKMGDCVPTPTATQFATEADTTILQTTTLLDESTSV